MARYSEAFKSRAVGKLLPPHNLTIEEVAQSIGVRVVTLERWRDVVQAKPARGRAWPASARLDALITVGALDETGKNAWCREHGIYPAELDQWRAACTHALVGSASTGSSPQAARQDRHRIKELERELLRKERALAETAALLVLSKKVAAIFSKGEDE
jgi:transposase